MSRTILLMLAVYVASLTCLASPRADFEAGLTAYRSGDMPNAILAWERVIDQNAASGPVYYNLGNAYYRIGKIGPALLNYERARRLMPRDRDVAGNIDLAKLATVDKIEPPVRLIIWNWLDSIRDYFSVHELALMFYVMGGLAGAAFLIWRFGPIRFRTTVRGVMWGAVIVYVLVGFWYGWRAAVTSERAGIVMATKTDVQSAPDAASKQLFSLHEGTKVQLGETLSGWTNVRLADGRRGWLATGDVEKI